MLPDEPHDVLVGLGHGRHDGRGRRVPVPVGQQHHPVTRAVDERGRRGHPLLRLAVLLRQAAIRLHTGRGQTLPNKKPKTCCTFYFIRNIKIRTRMHSSRMRTARSLTVSRRIPRTPPPRPCMPLHNHTCPPQPCMLPGNHACPRQPHMPLATMYAPQQPCTPLATTHAPLPPATTHACPPQQPHMPPPLVHRITDACENITLPQLHCGR